MVRSNFPHNILLGILTITPGVLRSIIVDRLHNLGLKTTRLPLDAQPSDPHIPILTSDNLAQKKRIIILFYEHNQDLGIFAHRIVGGKGGINEGSAVNFVKYIQSLPTSATNPDSPGIILANMGQLRWYRRGKKAVTQTTWYALPQKSAASGPLAFDEVKNTVPDNRSTLQHASQVFYEVVKKLAHPDAKLDIISVSDGAAQVVDFLNNGVNWNSFGDRLEALALLSPFHNKDDIKLPQLGDWLRKACAVP